jgi:hypothetical protein
VANFGEQTAGKRKAPRTFALKPEHYAETWGGKKPVASVELGLRIPSEQDVFNAQVEAERAAEGREPLEAELFKRRKLLALVVARCICSPHDVSEPHPFFELPEDEVPLALKSTTIQRIYDEVERLVVEQSPIFGEATDAECLELSDLLAVPMATDHLDPVKAGHARRFILFALELLRNES